MRRLLCALVIILAGGQALSAEYKDPNYPDDPSELLQMKWSAVVSVLHNKDLDPNTKVERVNKIVTPIFDFELMSKLVLGRKHWPKLTPPQRKRFTELFVERLRTAYREKIALYTNEEAVFKPAVQKNKSIVIPMDFVSGGKEIVVQYKLRRAEEEIKVKVDNCWETRKVERWKVYDIEIQGVSILLTYRSQFDDVLENGTVEDLLERLEKQSAK